MANTELPKLNPLKARSTLAMVLALLSLVAPQIVEGLDQDGVLNAVEAAIVNFNELSTAIFGAWLWLERRAPNFRLGF